MTLGTREPTCRDVVAFLGDYLAGELGLAERAVFERHVAVCPECAAYLASYSDTIRLARDAHSGAVLPGALPDGLVDAILAAREHRPQSSRRIRRRP